MSHDSHHSQYCAHPDLSVRSVLDGDIFRVSRECLAQESDVFRENAISYCSYN